MRVYLFESNQPEKVIECKKEIRNLFDIGNHSVHSSDNRKESITLAETLFVPNSIHFLNYAKLAHFNKFESWLKKYRKWIEMNNLNMECFCIDASAILSAYGLRKCADLDYLHHGYDNISTGDNYIASHNSSIHHHVYDKDDIIFNPDNHFYYKNVKFAALHVIRAMKHKRNEPKDRVDVAMIVIN